MRVILLIALASAFCLLPPAIGRQPDWSTSFSLKPILSMDMFGAAGVCTDGSHIYRFRVATGELLDTIPFPDSLGSAATVVFADSGRTVVTYVDAPYSIVTNAPCYVVWIDVATKAELQRQKFNLSYRDRAYKPIVDVTLDRHYMALNVYMGEYQIRYFEDYRRVYSVDLTARTVSGGSRVSRRESLRFESVHDSLNIFIAKYEMEQYFYSHTGLYKFNGKNLLEIGSNKRHDVTAVKYSTIRYEPTDAHIVGIALEGALRGQVCVVDISRDVVLDTLETSVGFTSAESQELYDSVWVDRACTHAFRWNWLGELRCWKIDPQLFGGPAGLRVYLPDSVYADTLIDVAAVSFAAESSDRLLIDPGDERGPLVAPAMAWHTPGVYDVRIGNTNGTDTTWLAKKQVKVKSVATEENIARVFRSGRGSIFVLSIKSEDSILVTTSYGDVYHLDSSLQLRGIYRGSGSPLGSAWTSDGRVVRADGRQNTTYSSSESYTFTKTIDFYVVNLTTGRISGLRTNQVNTGVTRAPRESFPPLYCYLSTLSSAPGNTLYFADFLNTVSSGMYSSYQGGLHKYNALDSSLVKVNYITHDLPDEDFKNLEIGAPMYGAMHPNGADCVLLHESSFEGRNIRRTTLSVNVDGPTILSHKPRIASNNLQFVGTSYLVVDTAWFHYPSLSQAGTHTFRPPFASNHTKQLAAAWNAGNIYFLAPGSSETDSMPSINERPCTMAFLPSGRIIAGYTNGTLRLHNPHNYSSIGSSSNTNPVIVQAYPNPTSNLVTVVVSDPNVLPLAYSVYDVKGQVTHSGKLANNVTVFNIHTDLNLTCPGMYYLQTNTGTITTTTPIFVSE